MLESHSTPESSLPHPYASRRVVFASHTLAPPADVAVAGFAGDATPPAAADQADDEGGVGRVGAALGGRRRGR